MSRQDCESYRPSGRVRRTFFIWSAVLLLLGVAFALLMALLFRAGHYYVGLVPIAFALALSGLVMLAVVTGHCRSRVLAAGVGLVCGAVMYLGYFHWDMLMLEGVGIRHAHRLDLLPAYIRFRMQYDVYEDSSLPTPPREQDAPMERKPGEVTFNCVFFAMDLAICTLLPCVVGWLRAERPYCETCQAWMRQSCVCFERGAARPLQELLNQGELARLTGLPRVTPQRGRRATLLAVSSCAAPAPEGGGPCPVYLSVRPVKDARAPTLGGSRSTWGARPRERRLNPAEVAALSPLVPELGRHGDPVVAEVLEASVGLLDEREPSARQRALGGARIVEEGPEAGLDVGVLTGANVRKATVLSLLPFVGLLAGVAALGLGIAVMLPLLDPREPNYFPELPDEARWAIG